MYHVSMLQHFAAVLIESVIIICRTRGPDDIPCTNLSFNMGAMLKSSIMTLKV